MLHLLGEELQIKHTRFSLLRAEGEWGLGMGRGGLRHPVSGAGHTGQRTTHGWETEAERCPVACLNGRGDYPLAVTGGDVGEGAQETGLVFPTK